MRQRGFPSHNHAIFIPANHTQNEQPLCAASSQVQLNTTTTTAAATTYTHNPPTLSYTMLSLRAGASLGLLGRRWLRTAATPLLRQSSNSHPPLVLPRLDADVSVLCVCCCVCCVVSVVVCVVCGAKDQWKMLFVWSSLVSLAVTLTEHTYSLCWILHLCVYWRRISRFYQLLPC